MQPFPNFVTVASRANRMALAQRPGHALYSRTLSTHPSDAQTDRGTPMVSNDDVLPLWWLLLAKWEDAQETGGSQIACRQGLDRSSCVIAETSTHYQWLAVLLCYITSELIAAYVACGPCDAFLIRGQPEPQIRGPGVPRAAFGGGP